MPNPIITQTRTTRGKTVGKAVIKSFIHDIQHGHDPNFKPLYTQARFNGMVEGLKSEREYNIYLQYVAMYNGISEELVRSQAYAQQAQHGLLHLQLALSDVRRAEDQAAMLAEYTALHGLPMDQAAADRLVARMQGLFISLDTLAESSPLREMLHSYHDKLLLPALYGLCAYDTLIGLLSDALEIPELTALRADTADISRDLEAYAEDIATTPTLLQGDAEAIARKQALLDSFFIPVRLADAAPPAAAVDAVRDALAQPDAMQTGVVGQLFIQLLGGTDA